MYKDIIKERAAQGKKLVTWSEQVDYETLNKGDLIEIKLGDHVYLSEIDESGVQRFLPIGDHYDKYQKGEYDLNQIHIEFLTQNTMTQKEYAELKMGICYSISGFSELSTFQDMQLINPLWDYKQPEDIYLLACISSGKKTREEVVKEIMKRDGCSETDALEIIKEHFED